MPHEKNTLYCSFCGKSQHEVEKLIAGATVFICVECIALCADIVLEERLGLDAKTKLDFPNMLDFCTAVAHAVYVQPKTLAELGCARQLTAEQISTKDVFEYLKKLCVPGHLTPIEKARLELASAQEKVAKAEESVRKAQKEVATLTEKLAEVSASPPLPQAYATVMD